MAGEGAAGVHSGMAMEAVRIASLLKDEGKGIHISLDPEAAGVAEAVVAGDGVGKASKGQGRKPGRGKLNRMRRTTFVK